MDVRRRSLKPIHQIASTPPPSILKHASKAAAVDVLVVHANSPKASNALPLPLYLANGVFFTLQSFVTRSSHDDVWGADDEEGVDQILLKDDNRSVPCAAAAGAAPMVNCLSLPPFASPLHKDKVAIVDPYSEYSQR